MSQPPVPSQVLLDQETAELVLSYSLSTGEQQYRLPAEYLRVYSPSAEVRGHGAGQEVLQTGKRHVAITQVAMAGNYALQLTFDDGHDSGIYSWRYLEQLCREQDARWQAYLAQLKEAGASRDPDTQVLQFQP